MTERYVWKVYCLGPPGRYETVISETEPTSCPSGGEIDPAETTIVKSLFLDFVTEGYVNVESQLADNQAVKIRASNPNGGIDVDAGLGGVTVDTTNSISLDAGAASNFTAAVGDLQLEATAGVVNLVAGTGVNVGSAGTPVVNVVAGTGGFNVDTSGAVSLDASGAASNLTLATTGDGQDLTIALLGSTASRIVLLSQGTGDDSVRVESLGGIDADVSGPINLATSSTAGGAITLDTAFGGGGIVLSAGSQGIAINSTSGVVGIGHWSGSDVYVGTAAVARNVVVGNTVAGTRIFVRYGAAGLIEHQEAPNELGDVDATLTTSQLLQRVLVSAPTEPRTLILPDVSEITLTIGGVSNDDSFDFSIINSGSSVLSVSAGVGGTIVGSAVISTSGSFRLRYLTSSYVLYRLS